MATEVRLPQLGQTMEEGTIVSCLVNVGDKIQRGDVIFEVETDKASLEMESPADGFVKHITAEVGQTLAVGEVVLVVGGKDEKVEAPAGGVSAEKAAEAAAPAASPAPQAGIAVDVAESVKVVRLPQLGQTMEEGTIVNCLVQVGDEVKRGEVIFEVETDKAALEMECPAEGFVKFVAAKIGETLAVGEAVLVLGGKDDVVSQSAIDSLLGVSGAAAGGPVVKAVKAAPTAATKVVRAAGERIIASPRARKLAEVKGVDLSQVAGSGPAGRIVEADVEAATVTEVAVAGGVGLGESIPVNRLQKITAQRMLQSKQEIPCFYLTVKADVTDMVEYRAKINKTGSVKVAFNDFIMRAVALGLERFPIMTGQLAGDMIKLADKIGIGLAISVEDGLVAPIVKDVSNKDLQQVASYSQELIGRAKDNKLSPMDLEGGCITVSNLGVFGIESFIPIVVPGQCSILGVGQISDTCVPDNGNLMVRKMMSMTLSVDHKVANGAYAAQFLDFVRKTLEDMSNF